MPSGEEAFGLLIADNAYKALSPDVQRQVISVFAAKDQEQLQGLIAAGKLDMPTSKAIAGLFDHALKQQGIEQEQTYADWLAG